MSSEVLDRLDGVLDELAALSWGELQDPDVVQALQRLETAKRRFAVIEHAGINHAEQRCLPSTLGARTTGSWLSQTLRIGRGEACARVRAAHDLGTRMTVTGELVGPRFPHVAAAQAAGVISDRHAAVITKAVDQLADDLVDKCGEFVEKTLTEHAADVDPTRLAGQAEALLYALDQDGQEDKAKYRERTRSFDVHRHADGSSEVRANLNAEATAHLLVMLDAMTQPGYTGPRASASDAGSASSEGGPDPRTATQRRHDAFLQWLLLVERAELLPPCHGVTSTVVLTMEADAWATGTGTARTGHGYTVPAYVAKNWAGADSRMMLTLLTKTKAVAAYSSTHRIFTEGQRLAMLARDKGCTFPGCTAQLQWLQAHHIREWANGGETSVTNGGMVCCGDHREHEAMGWYAIMIDGIVHWVPPKWLDPDQKPRRNTLHD